MTWSHLLAKAVSELLGQVTEVGPEILDRGDESLKLVVVCVAGIVHNLRDDEDQRSAAKESIEQTNVSELIDEESHLLSLQVGVRDVYMWRTVSPCRGGYLRRTYARRSPGTELASLGGSARCHVQLRGLIRT